MSVRVSVSVLKTPVFVIGICVNFLSIMEPKNDNARRERGKNYTEKETEMALTVIDR
jgi:hypothetical protein